MLSSESILRRMGLRDAYRLLYGRCVCVFTRVCGPVIRRLDRLYVPVHDGLIRWSVVRAASPRRRPGQPLAEPRALADDMIRVPI